MKHIYLLAALITLMIAGLSSAPAQAQEEPRLVAATFRSNWCGPCRVLEPRFTAVFADYAGAQIDPVYFDFTFGRRAALTARADAEGIRPVFDSMDGATGYVLLIDRETQDVLARITMHYSEDDIRGALEHALALIADRQAYGL